MSLQISTLVSHRERPLCSDRSLRAVARVGQAVNLAVERFVTVGETIADDNPDIKQDMYEACKEARVAGYRGEKERLDRQNLDGQRNVVSDKKSCISR
ncbi:Alpha-catulin [Harpegnathos saltator]|uniref:Alpha-catulin n=1 Tax=Harpegnathos saltator TaxID=610380 RepID=E2B5J1_HARSA|nr:Alpha-catulin [Harpegnathos saltator]